MTGVRPTTDPVLLAVLRGRLEQVVEEMDAVLVRSSFSPIVSEAQDRANGLYAFPCGETIVQGSTGLPIFIGSMQATVGAVSRSIELADLRPGDVFAINDPYQGGTHLQDVKLVQPVFHDGEPILFLANTVHWIDIGGSVPGGFASRSTEIFQEGIRFGAVRLVRGGAMNHDVRSLLLANVRVPRDIEGDLQAQLSALAVGQERIAEVLARHGGAELLSLVAAMQDASEREMRSYLADIPDGTYDAVDYLDDDGLEHEPLTIRLRLSIAGDEASFDFTGSSPLCRGPMNVSPDTAIAACHVAMKHLFPSVPINAGCFKPMHFEIPRGTLLHAESPYPVGGYFETSSRVADVVWQALAKGIPDRLFGTPFSTAGPMLISSRTGGDLAVAVLNYSGGYGATSDEDGLVGACPPLSVAPLAPVEIYEHRSPLRFNRLAIRPDSGGPGRRRGGCGTEYDLTFTGVEGRLSTIADRGRVPPPGVAGGGPGGATEVVIVRADGEEYRPEHVTKDQDVVLRRGDRIVVRTPGGGGFGDPREREVELVRQDVVSGLVTSDRARRDYGAEPEQRADGTRETVDPATAPRS